MSEFAIYVHKENHDAVIHKISCGHIKQTGAGDVTVKGFWVKCDSLKAAETLCGILKQVGYEPGSRDGDWYCDVCKPKKSLTC